MIIAHILSALEACAATDQGRGSEALAVAVRGDLHCAVNSLAGTVGPHIVILTGFAIPTGQGEWSAETDGPVGAVQLAQAALKLSWNVRVLTDTACAEPIRAIVPATVPVDVVDAGEEGAHECPALIAKYQRLGVTHVVSIERVGPSPDGRPRNMRGEDISASTACLHHVVGGGDWYSIGIGDGGNEIGMGRLPLGLVEKAVPVGERIRCISATSALIVGGTSNWGAAALVAALSVAMRRLDILDVLADGSSLDVLRRLVQAGAVDGVSRRPSETVDGLDWLSYQHVVNQLSEIGRAGGEMA